MPSKVTYDLYSLHKPLYAYRLMTVWVQRNWLHLNLAWVTQGPILHLPCSVVLPFRWCWLQSAPVSKGMLVGRAVPSSPHQKSHSACQGREGREEWTDWVLEGGGFSSHGSHWILFPFSSLVCGAGPCAGLSRSLLCCSTRLIPGKRTIRLVRGKWQPEEVL